ncbi:hypothetical protein AVEN_257103-1 [Araneus ventricosus]|uniref:Uncharacterized protein n=1 Tax=Araneus ventricosus TaxID=182803 RepID=A0A4Y2FUA3_ARAVE|nr:hypothetical protein AVEN_257103-1 [Araneus ventricosus]
MADIFSEKPLSFAQTLHHPRRKDYFLHLPDVTVFTFRLHKQILKLCKLLQDTPRAWTHEILRDNFVLTAIQSNKLAPFHPQSRFLKARRQTYKPHSTRTTQYGREGRN